MLRQPRVAGVATAFSGGADEQDEQDAHLAAVLAKAKREAVPPSESCRKLVEYTRSHQPDAMLACDRKWATRKPGAGRSCLIM